MNILRLLITLLLLTFVSCKHDSITNPEPIDERIVTFVNSYSFPKIQPITTYIRIKESSVTGFYVQFGEPSDCPSGCIYSSAYGLQKGDRIGWLTQIDSTYFNFDSTDTYLFSVEFWDKLNQAQVWVYRSAFLPLLVKDLDTPISVLERIAKGSETYIDVHLCYLLLDNPIVKTDRATLTILANLPVYQGDGYEPIRQKARELLDGLGA